MNNVVIVIKAKLFEVGLPNLIHILILQETDGYCFSRSGFKGQGHTLNIII